MTLEEIKESPETKETVTEPVTDEALESALEQPEVIETEVEAKVEPEVKKELPSDQEERTRLGRHLKRLEERLDRDKLERENLSQKFDEVLSRFDRPSREEGVSEEVDEVIATAADVRRIARADRIKEEQERARDQGRYEENYIRTLRNFERDNPTLHQEIFKEMMTNFNVRRSNSPSLDADLNYTKAKSAVLAKKISAVNPQPKVAGAKTTASTDLSIESRDIATGAKEIKLDEFAESFRKSSGMSDESVRQAIGKK
jgi:hypothetical protein